MKEIKSRLVALSIGIVIAVFLLEVFFYVAPNFLPKSVRIVSASIFDGELRQHFKPDYRSVQVLDDGDVWELNTVRTSPGGIGARDDGVTSADVVVVGDSHAYGHGVNLEDVWTEIIEKETGLDVVNMGQPSAFPATQNIVLERYGMVLKPKTVIYTIFQNDWVDAAAFKHEKSGFTLLKRSLDSYSSTYRLIRYLVNLQTYQSYKAYDKYENGNVSFFLYPLHMGKSVDLENADILKSSEEMVSDLSGAKSIAESSGSEILFVIFPSKEQVYWEEVKNLSDKERDIDAMNKVVLEFCQRTGSECVDLTPYFKDSKSQQLFFEIDGHPNGNGQRLVADRLIERLLVSE